MSRPLAVLRPEPGNSHTAAAIEAAGGSAIRLPLFEVRPLAWHTPPAEAFDALILTSANALRHGGPDLARYAALPVHAVGRATAEAARRKGLVVAATGDSGAKALIEAAAASGVRRALHLGGRERTIEAGGIVAQAIAVYASEPLVPDPLALAGLAGSVALVHSARAAARLAALVDRSARSDIAVAAISTAAAGPLGGGWAAIRVADAPDSERLLAAARALAD